VNKPKPTPRPTRKPTVTRAPIAAGEGKPSPGPSSPPSLANTDGQGGAGTLDGGGGTNPPGDDGLPIMPIAFSLAVLGGTGVLLIVMHRRRPKDLGSVVGLQESPEPPQPAWSDSAPTTSRRDDGLDGPLPGEEGIPRWRRPSVQAARFATSAGRQTVYERYVAESPGVLLTPIKELTGPPVPPPPSKQDRLAARNGAPPEARKTPRGRNLTSPGSA
jgi:hypothetical protein